MTRKRFGSRTISHVSRKLPLSERTLRDSRYHRRPRLLPLYPLGSPVYAYLAKTPEVIRIRLGALDTRLTDTPKAHTFVSERASWSPIEDSVPQFPEWAPRDVLRQAGSKQP